MILIHCEGFGYNVEPTIERLSPSWAKFKAESTYYSRAISSAPSTLMSLFGVLTGQYPAYSRWTTLTSSYLRDTRELGGTWLSDLFPHRVAVAPESIVIAKDIDFSSQMTGNYYDDLRNALANTPKPRLIYVYVPDWKINLGAIHKGEMTVEEAYLDKGTNIARETTVFDILPRDELVVAWGDHSNAWLNMPLGHAVNVSWDTIRAPIAIRSAYPQREVIDRLVSHLDLPLILADRLGAQWTFPEHSYEHGVMARELAYTRTCFMLQGHFTPQQLRSYPPLLSVTDGHEQAVFKMPITASVGLAVSGSLSYFEEGVEVEAPSENHKSMAKSLLDLEESYRRRALGCGLW